MPGKKSGLPTELEGIASVEQLNSLEARLEKSYSSERYEEFQDAVEKIINRTLETESAHNKLETKIQAEIKKYMDDKGWKNKTFWIPTIISTPSSYRCGGGYTHT